MEDLIVVTYRNEYSAQENLQTLRTLQSDWLVEIHDAVAVARDADGKLHIQDSYKATPQEGAGWGVLIGMILGGLALVPFTAVASAAVTATVMAAGGAGGALIGGLTGAAVATAEKEDNGVSEYFVSEVAANIKRGQSAIFALVESHDPQPVAEYFRGTGGTIIRTNLSPSERWRVQQILAGH